MCRMYTQTRTDVGASHIAGLSSYKYIKNEYNLAFHRPKKDKCTMCSTFDKMENKTEEQKRLYEEHRE